MHLYTSMYNYTSRTYLFLVLILAPAGPARQALYHREGLIAGLALHAVAVACQVPLLPSPLPFTTMITRGYIYVYKYIYIG
jgi:hypothetical protein